MQNYIERERSYFRHDYNATDSMQRLHFHYREAASIDFLSRSTVRIIESTRADTCGFGSVLEANAQLLRVVHGLQPG